MESIEVRKQIYPYRYDYGKFVHQYGCLDDSLNYRNIDSKSLEDKKNICQNLVKKIMPQADERLFLKGKDKLFLRQEVIDVFDQALQLKFKARKEYAARKMFALWKGKKVRTMFKRRREAV